MFNYYAIQLEFTCHHVIVMTVIFCHIDQVTSAADRVQVSETLY